VFNERNLGGSRPHWKPSVVLEGRVTRQFGTLIGDGAQARRFADMYVHDAMFGRDLADADEPNIAATATGQHLVLPRTTSRPDRSRVLSLFERLFEYVKRANTYVAECVCAAEEYLNMDISDVQHAVLLIRGKRSRTDQLAARRRAAFGVNAGHHGRMHGVPEMCVVCPRSVAQTEQSAVVVNFRSGGLTDIPVEHRAFDSLYHVLLHPTGYVGWEDDMPRRTKLQAWLTLPPGVRTPNYRVAGSSALNPRDKVSMREYYSYMCHCRRGDGRTDNCKFMAARLFQEYLCVAFWRVETCRLNIHRMAQENMRQAQLSDLRHFVSQVNQGEAAEAIGRVSYMPESFVGGPADMYAKYQDSMASVLYRGAPSLFITMTANPRWREIQESLKFGQSAQDRNDIVARVFHAKLNELLSDIKAGKLGQHASTVHVIEFQKRGLPHAHIVVILASVDRPRTPEQINALSTAEIPPLPASNDRSKAAIAQRRLRGLVLEHMVHNDCSGPAGPHCPCWDADKGRCGGKFPFSFSNQTTMGDEQRRATLRRRHGQRWTAVLNGRCITNQWVVPYNPALLLKFQCHLNVEVVTAAYAIKYLYKYVWHDLSACLSESAIC
jgi:hypothetical protein